MEDVFHLVLNNVHLCTVFLSDGGSSSPGILMVAPQSAHSSRNPSPTTSVHQVTIKMPSSKTSKDVAEDDELEKCFMKVSGMTCSSCVANIEHNLSRMEG